MEKELHQRLAEYRIRAGGGSEWFNFENVDIESVVNLMKEYEKLKAEGVSEEIPSYYRSVGSDNIDILTVLAGLAIVGGLFFFNNYRYLSVQFKYSQILQPGLSTSDSIC